MQFRGLVVGGALLAALGCGDTGVGPDGKVASVTLTLSAGAIGVGRTAQGTATPFDATGAVAADKVAAWSTSNPAVAAISQSGLITGVAVGSADIKATVDGKSATQTIGVEASALKTIVVTPQPSWLLAGGSLQLIANGRDQFGEDAVIGPVTFAITNGSNAATLTSSGVVTALQVGTALGTAAANGLTGSVTINVVSPTTVAGNVAVVGPASPSNLVASVLIGAPTPASLIGAILLGGSAAEQLFKGPLNGGAFSFPAALPTNALDSVNIVIDAASGTRIFRPIYMRTNQQTVTAYAPRPLLVPESVTIPAGAYIGDSVLFSLNAAFTPMCADVTDTNCNSYFPRTWKTLVALWSESELPVPLAFNRAASTATISAADSSAMWSVIHGLETQLGRPLFRPADFSALPAPNSTGFSSHAVLVSVDGSLAVNSGFTNWTWGADANMNGAKTRVSSASLLGNISLMSHELLHALGFHHTCAWTSVMAYSSLGCSRSTSPSRTDVAGFTLAYMIRRTILAQVPTTGLFAALQGERVFELQLPAGSAPNPALAALGSRVVDGRLVFADSAH